MRVHSLTHCLAYTHMRMCALRLIHSLSYIHTYTHTHTHTTSRHEHESYGRVSEKWKITMPPLLMPQAIVQSHGLQLNLTTWLHTHFKHNWRQNCPFMQTCLIQSSSPQSSMDITPCLQAYLTQPNTCCRVYLLT